MRLQLAAVLKGDDLNLTMLETEAELFAGTAGATTVNDFDLVVLRANLGRASGFSVCNRLRSASKTAGAPKVVILADAQNDPGLVSHRASASAADAYITPPLGMKDLRIQAYALLDLDGGTFGDDEIQNVDADPFARLDDVLSEEGQRRMAAESSGEQGQSQIDHGARTDFTDDDLEGAFGNLTSDGRQRQADAKSAQAAAAPAEAEILEDADILEVPKAQAAPSPLARLSEDELRFVENAFGSVKDAAGAPPLPPGIKSVKDLRGPEAKIFMLREKLRERENEIKHLQDIWNKNEAEYNQSAQRVAEMEIEVKAAQMEVDDARRRLKERDDQIQQQQRGSSATIDQLLTEKVFLEKDLIEVVAAKEKNIAELRRAVASRERDIEQLQKQLAALQQELEQTRRTAAETLDRTRQEAALALDELRSQAQSALKSADERAKADAEAAEARRTGDLDALEQRRASEVAALEQQMKERLGAAAERLAGTEADLNAQLDEMTKLRDELHTGLTERTAERDRLLVELGEARAENTRQEQTGIDQATQLGELRVRTETLTTQLSEAKAQASAEIEALKAELAAARAELTGTEQRLGGRLSQREESLVQKDSVIEKLTREVSIAREEKDQVVARLSERLKEREATIAEQDKRLSATTSEKLQVETKLKVLLEERARLERSLALDDEPPAVESHSVDQPVGHSVDQPVGQAVEQPGDAVAPSSAPVSSPIVAPVSAPETATADPDEESIPIADSNESVILDSTKKVG